VLDTPPISGGDRVFFAFALCTFRHCARFMVDLLGSKVSERAPRGAIPRWCAAYGYSERAIKNWWKLGRDVGEAPPFDFPEAFKKWAERHLPKMTKRLEDGIAQATVEKVGAIAEEPAAAAEPVELPEIEEGELGMAQQLNFYRREFVMLQKLRAQALEKADFTAAGRYLEQGKIISAEIRQLEKALPLALELAGTYQKTAEIRIEVGRMLAFLKRSLLTRGARAGARLRTVKTEAEASGVWREEVEAVLRECVDVKFSAT
jgi:hypothetical protein